MQGGFTWKLGNGSFICFWEDKWLPDQTRLADVVIKPILKELLKVKIANIVSQDGV